MEMVLVLMEEFLRNKRRIIPSNKKNLGTVPETNCPLKTVDEE